MGMLGQMWEYCNPYAHTHIPLGIQFSLLTLLGTRQGMFRSCFQQGKEGGETS